MKNSITVAVACSLALALLVLSNASADLIEESFAVEKGGTLYLNADSGSIEVMSHNRDVVDVEVKRKGGSAENYQVTISQSGNDVKVKGHKKGLGFFSFGSSKVHFIVKVPQQYNVDLKTSGGSIVVASLRGKVDADTSGGSIKLSQIRGDVDVDTSGGSIRIDDIAGRINAHTSGGSIKVAFSQQPTGDSKLTSSGGGITAYLPLSSAVDLYASTSGGSVSSDFNVNGLVKRTKIDGEINGGGPELIMKTSGGSVRVKQLR